MDKVNYEIRIPDKYRFERKFLIEDLSYEEIEKLVKLNSACFKEIHQSRRINNIYFDTYNYLNYEDNVEGNTHRSKLRIRWYGNLFGECKNPVVEIKNKNGLLGWKDRYVINNFILNRSEYVDFRDLAIPKHKIATSHNLQGLRPVLINSYLRTYYLSSNRFRLTIDKNIDYYGVNPIRNVIPSSLVNKSYVIEIKYNSEHDSIVDKITQEFPFRLTKNSKYAVGIEKIII